MWPKAALAKPKVPFNDKCTYVHINTPQYIHTYCLRAINVKLLVRFFFSSTNETENVKKCNKNYNNLHTQAHKYTLGYTRL